MFTKENLCVAVLSIIPLRKKYIYFFYTKVIFIQGAFKNIQGLLGKIQGLFTDIQQFSNFQGLFKACANHAMDNTRTAWSKTEILQ